MNRLYFGLLVFVIAVFSVVFADESITLIQGSGGRTITVTTTTTRISFDDSVRLVSVYNASASNTIAYAAVNCTTTAFNAAVTGTNVIPIRGGVAYSFSGGGLYDSVCLKAASGTLTIDVAGKK